LYLLDGLNKCTIYPVVSEREAYWKTRGAGTIGKGNPNAFTTEAAVRQEVVDRIAARRMCLHDELRALDEITEVKMLDRT